jgi:hypothetical protein
MTKEASTFKAEASLSGNPLALTVKPTSYFAKRRRNARTTAPRPTNAKLVGSGTGVHVLEAPVAAVKINPRFPDMVDADLLRRTEVAYVDAPEIALPSKTIM